MKLFFDNNMSPVLAEMVNLYLKGDHQGHEAVHLRDMYLTNITDLEWVQDLSKKEGYVIVSADRFSKGSAEKLMIKNCGMPVFIVQPSWASQNRNLYISRFIALLPEIIELCGKRPAVYSVPFRGSIKPNK